MRVGIGARGVTSRRIDSTARIAAQIVQESPDGLQQFLVQFAQHLAAPSTSVPPTRQVAVPPPVVPRQIRRQ